jgi:hypothetical protein
MGIPLDAVGSSNPSGCSRKLDVTTCEGFFPCLSEQAHTANLALHRRFYSTKRSRLVVQTEIAEFSHNEEEKRIRKGPVRPGFGADGTVKLWTAQD